MKKVLMVSCDGLGNGGVQHVMMNIVRNLSKEFHFDMLLFTNEVRYFDAEFQKYGLIFRIPKYEGPSKIRRKLDYYTRSLRLYLGVKKILKENGPYDVIHCHNFFDAAPCLMAAAHCGVPVRIIHSHSAMFRFHKWVEMYQNLMRRVLLHYATHCIGCSQPAAESLFGKHAQSFIIPNAIDLKRFDISLYPASKTKHSFVHVGSFGTTKNQLFVLDVFSAVQKMWPDATLCLIGNKNEAYEALMHKKIKELNLQNVQFLPHNSDVPAFFAQSEYMIFPSVFEGLPLSLLEAQSMRVRCFVSDAVTKEANIGLCRYLSLKKPAEVWAHAVLETAATPAPLPDTSKVDLAHYAREINAIYCQGEKK